MLKEIYSVLRQSHWRHILKTQSMNSTEETFPTSQKVRLNSAALQPWATEMQDHPLGIVLELLFKFTFYFYFCVYFIMHILYYYIIHVNLKNWCFICNIIALLFLLIIYHKLICMSSFILFIIIYHFCKISAPWRKEIWNVFYIYWNYHST